jgi:hypothetical protein
MIFNTVSYNNFASFSNEEESVTILSRVRGSVTNSNRFRIGWLDLLELLLQSLLIKITKVHNRWLPKTRSIPYWTTSVFSSIMTDLVLIYESVTSSVSVVPWLTLHSWTLNHNCNLTDLSRMTPWRLTYEWTGWQLQYDWINQSQSHFATDSQSVSRFVLVSSPIWGSWPDI